MTFAFSKAYPTASDTVGRMHVPGPGWMMSPDTKRHGTEPDTADG
jgi:hypothetical protein